MPYFKVTAKQGHYGTGRYQPITFAIKAKDMLSAISIAKKMPSVKHHDSVLQAVMITKEEYKELRQTSAYDRKGFTND